MKDLFEKLDVDKSGTVSTQEIKKGLFELENGEALFDCMLNADIDGDGELSFQELLACAIDFNVYVRDEYLKKAFDHFDKDGSGDICHHEMLELISEEGTNLEMDCHEVRLAMDEFDIDKNGKFDYEEFKALMLQVMSRNGIIEDIIM